MSDEMASDRGDISSIDKRRSKTAAEPTPASGVRRAGAWLLHEFHEILPPLIFFFVGFNLIVLTTNLILADYSVAFANFMLATGGALIVGKVVPVVNALPFLGRYDRAPLIQPILFKTFVYWTAVLLARLLEHFIEFWLIDHHPVSDFMPYMTSTFSWIALPRSRFGYWFCF